MPVLLVTNDIYPKQIKASPNGKKALSNSIAVICTSGLFLCFMRNVIYFFHIASYTIIPSMEAENEITTKVTRFITPHFLSLYFGSLILCLLISYHPVLSILPHPVTAKGTVTQNKVRYTYAYRTRYHGRSNIDIIAPVINFEYNGAKYSILGGGDESYTVGQEAKVVFNAASPGKALQLSPMGMVDFPVAKNAFIFWVVISGLIFAFASADDHFTLLNFKVRKLTLPSFILVATVIICMPFFRYADLILFGTRTDCMVTIDSEFVGHDLYRVITYQAHGVEFKTYNEYLDQDDENIGKHFPLLYLSNNPERSTVYTFNGMYNNTWFVIVVISLIFLCGWFYASTGSD
ncbi:MAG: hypothetical protein JWO03_1138 [Bacteroidetes bacterium]|nr:hypothetical protein [Bacteroidota bacterium]